MGDMIFARYAYFLGFTVKQKNVEGLFSPMRVLACAADTRGPGLTWL
jgi:hypothetical protein